jgi:L-ascorbate metabolism protein UlaG (beta-lactamase superfamily)
MGYVRWLGHAAFEINIDNYTILVDPWLTNPLSPVKVEDYRGKVDLIIVTHDHSDHLGESIELLKENPKAKFIAVYELANFVAEQLGERSERIIGANIGGPVKIPDVNLKIMFFPANHSCSRGTPTGVLIIGKETSIYHAGDTGLAAEMALIGELYSPEIALLPIGGHFTMDAYQAAKAAEMLRARVIIPMHYNTFPVIQADPQELIKYVAERKLDAKVVVLKPGEYYRF